MYNKRKIYTMKIHFHYKVLHLLRVSFYVVFMVWNGRENREMKYDIIAVRIYVSSPHSSFFSHLQRPFAVNTCNKRLGASVDVVFAVPR